MIIVIGAECAACGKSLTIEGPDADGDLFLLVDPDQPVKAMARCKNAIYCAEYKNAKAANALPA